MSTTMPSSREPSLLEPPYTNDNDDGQSKITLESVTFLAHTKDTSIKNPYQQRSRTPLENHQALKKSKVESKIKLELGLPNPINQATRLDSEIEVLKASQIPATKPTTSGSGEDDDEDCIIIGQKGVNVLSDFPHSREDCDSPSDV
jgi:hypothetical protein